MTKHNCFGEFLIGCNYFASNKGVHMWKYWDSDVIDKDFAALRQYGIDYVRIFPIWSDFQPLTPHLRGESIFEIRHGEEPFPDTPAGRAGVDGEMLSRLERTIELAAKHRLKVMLELVTRWMSGRNFVPDMFWDKKFLSDPAVLKWQIRMIRLLVNTCKKYENVVAWGLGNENNCAANCESRDEAWLWTSIISDAIRSCDQTRPIISGMHGLAVNQTGGHWFIKDQAENNDILTIHPYPYYTPHCHRDRLTGIRTILHAEAESVLYSDIGKKPCLTQELGVLGPMIGNDDQSTKYLESVLWSLWTCGDLGALWWMAFDCDTFDTPYDWQATERELGFMDKNRNPKPMLLAMRDFKQSVNSLPAVYQCLPKRRADVACLLSFYQESWTVAYSAYVMAKQTGFDILFNAPEDPLPEADFYMLPSIKGVNCISRRKWEALLSRVKEGASLYISTANAFISSFSSITGLEVIEREIRTNPFRIPCDGKVLIIPAIKDGTEEPYRYYFKNKSAEVILSEEDGAPVLARNRYGKGWVYTLMISLEYFASYTQGVFDDGVNDLSCLYKLVFRSAVEKRLLIKDMHLNNVAVSEHLVDEETAVCVIINHGHDNVQGSLRLSGRIKNLSVIRGNAARTPDNRLQFSLRANDAAIVEVKF